MRPTNMATASISSKGQTTPDDTDQAAFLNTNGDRSIPFAYDLHCHTTHSWDGQASPGVMAEAARQLGLAGLALTDHDHLTDFQYHEPEELLVIPGAEITVPGAGGGLGGHIIGLGLNEMPTYGAGLLELMDQLEAQEAFILVPHPFSSLENYPALNDDLDRVLDRVHALEVTNPKVHVNNRRARQVAGEYDLAAVGGSDAHRPAEIGVGLTLVRERPASVDDLLSMLRKGKCQTRVRIR